MTYSYEGLRAPCTKSMLEFCAVATAGQMVLTFKSHTVYLKDPMLK